MFCALDDRCQSGDEKTKFGSKIANEMATVNWLKIDIRAQVFWSDISQWPKSFLHTVSLYNKSICCVLLFT